jgi:hypothetical protein
MKPHFFLAAAAKDKCRPTDTTNSGFVKRHRVPGYVAAI